MEIIFLSVCRGFDTSDVMTVTVDIMQDIFGNASLSRTIFLIPSLLDNAVHISLDVQYKQAVNTDTNRGAFQFVPLEEKWQKNEVLVQCVAPTIKLSGPQRIRSEQKQMEVFVVEHKVGDSF